MMARLPLDAARDFNLETLEELCRRTEDTDKKAVYASWADDYRGIVYAAIDLGMTEFIARRRNANYLNAFIEVHEKENA